MQVPPDEWRKISHKQRRALISKERRRKKRQFLAEKREEKQATLESQPGYLEKLTEEERLREEQERKEEAQRLLWNEAWLVRERAAQEKFRKRRELEERIQRDKEERERLIREEWEALQQKEREEEEKRERVRREKEERLKEALSVGDQHPAAEPWHNPLAPDDAPEPTNYGTERDVVNCSFYLKTGACRFGDRCSRHHPQLFSSTTLLIRGMYYSLSFAEAMLDEQDHDVALEHDEGDMYEHFREFFEDVLPEFSKAGRVIQFKVSCNYEPHLRGNVYVQYSMEEECAEAFRMFNGRWYAQRQLSCEFCPVQKWKLAICGLFHRKRCPKGKRCNFLHVFRNPGGAFSRADHDLSPTPRRRDSREWSYRRDTSHREKHHFWDRSRSKSRSRSPDRSWSRYSRRARSRERYRGERRRSDKGRRFYSHRSRSKERGKSGSRSPRENRSYSRSRSRSPESKRFSARKRSRHSRSRSPEGKVRGDSRSPDREPRRHTSKKKKRSRSESGERKNRSDSRSPERKKKSSHKHKKRKHHKHEHHSESKVDTANVDGIEQKGTPLKTTDSETSSKTEDGGKLPNVEEQTGSDSKSTTEEQSKVCLETSNTQLPDCISVVEKSSKAGEGDTATELAFHSQSRESTNERKVEDNVCKNTPGTEPGLSFTAETES